ncbi:MAG: ATP synthase subunit I [Iodobacter sp.]|jgi:ATP synthase protein I
MIGKAQVRGIIRLKIGIAIAMALLLLLILGQNPAISSLLGGFIAVVGSVLYASIAYRVEFAPPAVLLKQHFAAEMCKLVCTLVAFAALFILYRKAEWLWTFAGYLAATSAFWFGLLIKFDGKK